MRTLLTDVRIEAMRADGSQAVALMLCAWIDAIDGVPTNAATGEPMPRRPLLDRGRWEVAGPRGAHVDRSQSTHSVLVPGRWLVRIGDRWLIWEDSRIALLVPQFAERIPEPPPIPGQMTLLGDPPDPGVRWATPLTQ